MHLRYQQLEQNHENYYTLFHFCITVTTSPANAEFLTRNPGSPLLAKVLLRFHH
jgi:hypothetical protein